MKISLEFVTKAGNAIKGLTGLNSEINKTGKSYASFYAKNKKVNQALNNLSKDSNRASGSFKVMTKAFQGFNNVLGIARISAWSVAIGGCIQASMDSIETQNLFQVAMGETAESTDRAVRSMSELTGLDLTNLRNSVGTYSLLAKSMGMSAKQSETLALNTSKLALDLASLTNVSVDQAMKDLKSGLVGQSETMYKYGVDVTEAGIKQEAFRQGITKSVREMSQGEKMALRYSAMLRQTGLAHGDFAKTLEQPANQMRVLKERFVNLSRAIGNIFMPILGKVLPYLNAFVIVLTRCANAIAKFFGFKAEDVKNGQNSMLGVSDDAEATADSLDKATASAKKFKSSLMGFDEINILPSQDDSGGSGSGSGGVGGGASILDDYELPSYDNLFDTLSDKANKLADEITPKLIEIAKWVGIVTGLLVLWNISSFIAQLTVGTGKLTGLAKAIDWIVDIIALSKGETISSTLKTLYPVMTRTIGLFGALSGIFISVIGTIEMFKTEGFSLKALLEQLSGVVLVFLGLLIAFNWQTALIVAGIVAVGIGVAYVVKYWDELCEWAKTTWQSFGDFWSNLWTTVTTFFVNIWDGIVNWFMNLPTNIWNAITSLGTMIGDFFVNLWDSTTTWVSDIFNNVVDFLTNLPETIAYWLGVALGKAILFFIKLGETVKTQLPIILEKIKDWFVALPQNILNWLVSTREALIKWRRDVETAILEFLLRVLAKTIEFFNNLGKWLRNLPSNIWSALTTAMNNIKAWGSNVLGFAKSLAENLWNKAISFIRELPSKLWNAVISIRNKFYNIGSYIVDGILDGINNLQRKVKNVANSFVQGFKDALGIHSPSRVMRDEVGKYLGLGIAEGLDNSEGAIINSANKLGDNMVSAFSDINATPSVSYEMSDFGGLTDATFTGRANLSSTQKIEAGSLGGVLYDAVFTAIKSALPNNDKGDVVIKVGSTEFGRIAINSINSVTDQDGKLSLNI